MPRITTIITDVGGVLINEYSRTGDDVQARVGMNDKDFGTIWPEIVTLFGSGKIDEQTVWQMISNSGGAHVDINENIMGKPFADSLTIYSKVLDTMKLLQTNGVQLGILSNTITPHVAILKEAGIYEYFGNHVYLSNEIGLRKPDLNAYRLVIEKMNIYQPETVLYIDDRPENLTPAQSLGMQTLLAENEDQIADSLKSYLN